MMMDLLHLEKGFRLIVRLLISAQNHGLPYLNSQKNNGLISKRSKRNQEKVEKHFYN